MDCLKLSMVPASTSADSAAGSSIFTTSDSSVDFSPVIYSLPTAAFSAGITLTPTVSPAGVSALIRYLLPEDTSEALAFSISSSLAVILL